MFTMVRRVPQLGPSRIFIRSLIGTWLNFIAINADFFE